MTSVIITDGSINRILSAVGYPVLDIDDLELTKSQIEELIVIPVLREYYRYFPLLDESSVALSAGEFSEAFPSTETFTAIAKFNIEKSNEGGQTNNPFTDARNFHPRAMGMYGTVNDYSMYSALVLERLVARSKIGANKTFSLHVNIPDRVVEGYTNTTGTMYITWMAWDNTFENLPFDRIEEVIQLCQAYLLNSLAIIRGQIVTNTGPEFDIRLFTDKADKIIENVITKWKEMTKVAIVRG